jgi:hypothetical protein
MPALKIAGLRTERFLKTYRYEEPRKMMKTILFITSIRENLATL